MNATVWRPDGDRFSRQLLWSAAVHGAIAIALTVRTFVFPSESIQIRNAIRVDVVDLPDKIKDSPAPQAASEAPKVELKDQAASPPAPKPEAKAPAPKKPDPKVNTRSQKSAIDKLKALDAIESLKKEVAEEKSAKAVDNLVKGNIVSSGNSLSGLDRIEYDRFFGQLESHIRTRWSLPKWLDDLNLKAQAVVKLDANGNVIQRQIVTSSGNETFDTVVLSTIDQSSPFPPPPARLVNVLQYQGIVFNFPK